MSKTTSVKQPNILLVTTDQQRYDSCGPLAPPFMRTPHFDHLAREGIAFSAAYADCPLCVPSRVSIMTGKTVFRHGMFGNGDTSTVMGRDGTLPSCLRAELLRRQGERGSAIVKDGDFVVLPLPTDSVADRRNRSWPGYHTEWAPIDVRH